MASEATKQKKKKMMGRMKIVIGAVFYIFALLIFLKAMAYHNSSVRSSAGEAVQYALSHPFEMYGVREVFKQYAGMIFLVSGIGALLLYIFTIDRTLKKHDNPETVHGAAHFMNQEEYSDYCKTKTDPIGMERIDGPNNIIFSKEMRLAIDNKATRRNLNVLVIGGSGAGKSFFYIAPNIMQFNANYVVTDPSGELLRDYGKTLEDHGYRIKVFNLTDVYKGNRYNPFHYIQSEKDVFTLTETLMKNTTPPGQHSGDPFWEKAEKLLLNVAILYLWHTYPEEQQTFTNVVTLIQQAAVMDEEEATTSEDPKSALDHMIAEIEEQDPHNLTVRQYKSFKLGADKTVRSILISCSSRLESFQLPDIEYLTSVDDMHFETFTDTRQALFVITPTADTTFGFLTAMLFSQMFAIFYDYCETKAGFGWQAYIPMESHYKPLTLKEKLFHTNLNVPTGGKEILKVAHGTERTTEKAQKQIEAVVDAVKKNGTVVKKGKDGLYRIYAKLPKGKRELLGWRGTKELAQNFVSRLKYIKAEKCGDRCPNHVRFLLDEFANSVTRSAFKTEEMSDKDAA